MITNVEGSKVDLKFVDGPKADERYSFFAETQEISIGRMPECSIRFDGNSVSRYQATIKYDDGWYFSDGYKGKKSTNGCWLFVDQPYTVHNNMIFKAGNIIFEVLITN